jgi:hypothetical protein
MKKHPTTALRSSIDRGDIGFGFIVYPHTGESKSSGGILLRQSVVISSGMDLWRPRSNTKEFAIWTNRVRNGFLLYWILALHEKNVSMWPSMCFDNAKVSPGNEPKKSEKEIYALIGLYDHFLGYFLSQNTT